MACALGYTVNRLNLCHNACQTWRQRWWWWCQLWLGVGQKLIHLTLTEAKGLRVQNPTSNGRVKSMILLVPKFHTKICLMMMMAITTRFDCHMSCLPHRETATDRQAWICKGFLGNARAWRTRSNITVHQIIGIINYQKTKPWRTKRRRKTHSIQKQWTTLITGRPSTRQDDVIIYPRKFSNRTKIQASDNIHYKCLRHTVLENEHVVDLWVVTPCGVTTRKTIINFAVKI